LSEYDGVDKNLLPMPVLVKIWTRRLAN